MSSLRSPAPITSGRRATGRGTPIFQSITGYRARGCLRRIRACCGPLDIGAGAVVSMFGTQAIGARPLASTAASATGSAIRGQGYEGGYWSGGSFYYNRSVTHISNTTVINNVYSQPVANHHVSNVSYNGGNGGIRAQPTPQELQARKNSTSRSTQEQQHHQQLASTEQGFARVGE